jgi:hypothetical protein
MHVRMNEMNDFISETRAWMNEMNGFISENHPIVPSFRILIPAHKNWVDRRHKAPFPGPACWSRLLNEGRQPGQRLGH